jgi:integrase
LIYAILNGAIGDDQALLSNPVKRIRPPHCTHVETPYLDEVEAARMVELLENEPIQYKTMVLLLLCSGIRRGELCGLEWSDIDIENHLISIRWTSQYPPGKGIYVKGTKTASSIRTIKLPTVAIDILREYWKWQTLQRLSVGDQWEDCNRQYTSRNGRPAHPDTLKVWFEDF